MAEVDLSAGVIEYEDTGGSGSVVVLLHGLAQNGSVWRHVRTDLQENHRVVVPTLPLGGHRYPLRSEADISMRGLANMLSEFLERLQLSEVTVVESDWGGLPLLLSTASRDRITGLVLAPCEAFGNYPPGIPGRAVWLAAQVPGGLYALTQSLRLRPLRRFPGGFGWMTKRPVPHDVTDSWLRPLTTSRAIRRDLRAYLRSVDKRDMTDAAELLRSFHHPAAVVWASEDRIMPPKHGRRLAELLPQGQSREVSDSYTLIPEDQPGELAAAIRDVAKQTR